MVEPAAQTLTLGSDLTVDGPEGDQILTEFTKSLVIKETKATIRTSSPRHIDIGISSLLRNRRLLESFLQRDKDFLKAMTPVGVKEGSPEVVLRMCAAAEKFEVGPMASVAGALADLCLEDMLDKGARFGMVENGGEIVVQGMRELLVSIYAGNSPLSNRIGLQLTNLDLPIGIGTSSATVGHAKSLGESDAAVAICENACLADAAATALGNKVQGSDPQESIRRALDTVDGFPDLRGMIVIRGNWIGTLGRLPQLVKINQSFRRDIEVIPLRRRDSSEARVTRLESVK